ncbi:hypothetical protein Syun_019396 [Stephania yunnanensis]|uniref:Uncharacterized protein n=1 Tax=Stephania yunnanensis TaxID=152371 RepID=A0AAP0NXC8_9MAGN
MNIDVNSDKLKKPQIESEEDQSLVLVQLPTLTCTFGTPYKGVEVRECLQIFYNADTFVLDEPDTIDSFVLEVTNELLNLKEGLHASLPKYVDAPFVIDISKRDVMEGWRVKFCRRGRTFPLSTLGVMLEAALNLTLWAMHRAGQGAVNPCQPWCRGTSDDNDSPAAAFASVDSRCHPR